MGFRFSLFVLYLYPVRGGDRFSAQVDPQRVFAEPAWKAITASNVHQNT